MNINQHKKVSKINAFYAYNAKSVIYIQQLAKILVFKGFF